MCVAKGDEKPCAFIFNILGNQGFLHYWGMLWELGVSDVLREHRIKIIFYHWQR